jgi:protein TonB
MKYPEEAKELGVQGKVFVTFVVEVDGSITDVKVLRGIGSGCDDEAVRVVKSMPKWVPGKQRGVPVRVQFNLPINFKLQ